MKQWYAATLATRLAAATRNLQSAEAAAFREEQKHFAEGGEVPGADDPGDQAALKAVRAAYRKGVIALEADREARVKAILARYDTSLAQSQALLTQGGRLDEGLEIKAKRDGLAVLWLKPATTVLERSVENATKAQPFVNTLGMKFVPVPILGGPTGGQRVLFSVWDTRVQDYEVFAKETKREWPKPDFEQGPTHPAVNVSWEDAQSFCQWLTAREQAAGRLPADWRYRLPSDHEWSCAMGIGEREDAAKLPAEKSRKIGDVYPWGSQWPPPQGAGNYAGEEARAAVEAGKYHYLTALISGFSDGFVETSPVGSFAPNRFGLFDMGGNVWQLCADWFDQDQKAHVRRGGSWSHSASENLLSSMRLASPPTLRYHDIGFRCVLEAPDSSSGSRLAQTAGSLPAGSITKEALPRNSLAQTPTAAPPAPKTEIRGIRELKFQDYILADGVDRLNWTCLRVNLRSSADLKGDEVIGKAYYFDGNYKLLSQFEKMPKATHTDGAYGLPPILKAHTEIDVYVPIETVDKDGKWRTVVLVFGDPRKLDVALFPRRERVTWKDFDFPERARILEQLKDADGSKN